MSKEMKKNIDTFKDRILNEGDSPKGYHSERITREGYLKVEIIDDTLNNGKNSLVRIRCMDKSNRECELLVFSSDLKDDKIDNIISRF